MRKEFLAIINPAAGGGKCRKQAGPVLERLRLEGITIDQAETKAAGEAVGIAREAYKNGYRKFIAVGGDGTSYEIVNGLFPEAQAAAAADQTEIPTLGFLPLGTGNSFVRDFVATGARDMSEAAVAMRKRVHGILLQKRVDKVLEHAIGALLDRRERPCDVMRLTHKEGTLHYINLLSVGFAADVAMLRHRQFLEWGPAGYWLSIFMCLARLDRRPFPVRVDDQEEFDRRRCLFLTFNNSKYTGGTMMIAPSAVTDDGLIEFVRWGAIGRPGLAWNLPGLQTGEHLKHPLAERKSAQRIDFKLEGPVDLMVDGEVLSLECRAIDVLPSALKVVV